MRLTDRGYITLAIVYLLGVWLLWIVAGLGSMPKPLHHSQCYVNQTCGEDVYGNPITLSWRN